MEITELAFDALKERKTRSILTIVMVVVGSSLMIALSGLSGGFAQFTEKQFSSLAPNVLFVSSAQQLGRSGGGFGVGGVITIFPIIGFFISEDEAFNIILFK